MHSFSQYSFITLFISTTYVSGDISSLISDFNYLSLFSVNRLAKSLSVLLILSKNQLLVSLIFYSIFQSLFHWFLLQSLNVIPLISLFIFLLPSPLLLLPLPSSSPSLPSSSSSYSFFSLHKLIHLLCLAMFQMVELLLVFKFLQSSDDEFYSDGRSGV